MNGVETKDRQEFDETKNRIKDLLRQLKKGNGSSDLAPVKNEFKETLKKATPLMIALAEQELVKEGFSIDDLMSACDIHLELFRESVENPSLKVPEGHPIDTFQKEHKAILGLMDAILKSVKEARSRKSPEEASEDIERITALARRLMEAESHNVRQENTLFPVLEKHGIEQPPAIMWMEHTEMKEQKKQLLKLLDEKEKYSLPDLLGIIQGMATRLFEKFASHTQKEQNILYATALSVITDGEWKEIKAECDGLGYFNLSQI